MQIVLHTGAHLTDEDRLLKCLRQNETRLESHNVSVPRPAGYRKWIRTAIQDESLPPLDSIRNEVHQSVIGDSKAQRFILSNSGFLGTEKMSFTSGHFYRAAESRINILHGLFPAAQIEMFMAIRNPASFLPLLYYNYHSINTQDRLFGIDLLSVRWSDFFIRIRRAFPMLPITVWCNEDTPLIWPKLLRTITQIGENAPFEGDYNLLHEILSDEGLRQFQKYISGHADLSIDQKQRVISAFLKKFARKEALEEEINMPGWSNDLTEQLTAIYDDDLEQLSCISDLNLILPD